MHNPYGPQLIIDSCKGETLYKSLEKYNDQIIESCKGYTFVSDRKYNLQEYEASWWFDPRCVRDLAISHVYPRCLEVQKDPRFCLILYAPNYFSLLLISTLYDDRNIMIEDQAGGQGALLFYLSKLGFTNLNLIDNFTQLPQGLYENLMSNIPHRLNEFQEHPKILNLVGYTYFIKPVSKDTELIITYNNTDLIIKGEGEDLMYRNGCLEKFSLLENKVCFAIDKYGLARAYCNKNKLQEFKSKLGSIYE